MKKHFIIYVVIAVLILAGCTNDKNTENTGARPGMDIYGEYSFEKKIYMNPLSSFIVLDGYKEYYTLAENIFTINQTKYEVTYEQAPVDEDEFRSSFIMDGPDIPDISSYKERYQYILRDASGSDIYRIYFLDDEIWLVKMHKDNANIRKSEYIWSIYKIIKS